MTFSQHLKIEDYKDHPWTTTSLSLCPFVGRKSHSDMLGTLHRVVKAYDGRATRHHIIPVRKGKRIAWYVLDEEGVGMYFDWCAKTHKGIDYTAFREAAKAEFQKARIAETAGPLLPIEPEAGIASVVDETPKTSNEDVAVSDTHDLDPEAGQSTTKLSFDEFYRNLKNPAPVQVGLDPAIARKAREEAIAVGTTLDEIVNVAVARYFYSSSEPVREQ